MKTNSSLDWKLQLAFGSAIVTLLVVGAISYHSIVVSSESDRWVRHTHAVLENLGGLLVDTENVESSYRGFVLSGQESYLDSYHSSRLRADQDETNLRTLTADNSTQQGQFPVLERLTAEKIRLAETVVSLRQTQGLQAAADAIRAGPGEGITNEFQGVIRQMQDEELRLLLLRDADARRRLGQTKTVLIFGTIFGLLVATAAGWSLQRDSFGRGLADQALRDSEERYRILLGRDLSDSKESGAKYRGLLEAAPDAMVVVNQAGDIVLLNVQAEKQLGYSRDELVGQKVKNIIPEGFAERLIADGTRTAAEALAQQIGTGIELIARRKDGSEFPIEIMLSPLESAEGILVTAAIRDISVRKAAEKHLGQMEGRYRGLLEAAPDAMVVVNQAGDIVLLNVQAEKQLGYSRDELVGQKVKNIIPEGFAERLIADALRSAEDALAQQIGTGIELTGRHKNGSEFPIEIMLSPLESAEGILVTAAIRDITARKQAEAHLLLKIAELNRSNEELGQFAYIASHDLQEPLRMVASYTQLLSRRYKGKLDADADEFISFAVDGASRMQRLIQDLLAYSRVGTKGKDLLDTSSESSLQQALLNLRGAIEESGALVTHDPLPSVLADDMQLTQLFQNLIGNAIKYQSPGVPKVHISAARNVEKQWIFSVKDNGLGIDPQYFEKIFGMFQRLHKREEFAGTGIGLAICKKIVERHGGSISVESQPGQGSTFRFALEGSERKTMNASGGS
jgi:PAS domain S-box-containing protein